MEKIVGKEVTLPLGAERLYSVFSDLRGITSKLPEEYKSKVTATQDTIEGEYNGMKLGLKVAQRIENQLVSLKPSGAFPFDFTLNFLMDPLPENKTKFRIEVDAEMNFLIRSMFGGKIKEMIDKMTDAISQFSPDKQ
ncbi:MAG: hypothetical protein LKM37_05930 [Bacteroidales bacterium]|jgi:carbon monoxide dehydrogenase subunit G|nr:hypothetical protein [Bacteroidales bacterium]MCI1734045.1 hypothetical protein [Bacteroidales bacterium]